MKWLIRIIVALVILLVVGVFALYLSLDHIVKSVVESQGTEQLNVPTTLGSVDLGLFKGTVSMDDMAIGYKGATRQRWADRRVHRVHRPPESECRAIPERGGVHRNVRR